MSGVTMEKCFEIINEFEPSAEGRQHGQLGIDGNGCVAVFLVHGKARNITTYLACKSVGIPQGL